VRIAVGADHLEDLGFGAIGAAAGDRQHGNVEGAAAKIEDDNLLVLFLIQPVS
jgi:hypothetical protein